MASGSRSSIEASSVRASRVGFQEFVKLRVDRERVPPVRSLDEQRHGPYNQGGDRMPVECARLRQKPEHSVEDDNNKGRRMAGEGFRQPWSTELAAPEMLPSEKRSNRNRHVKCS